MSKASLFASSQYVLNISDVLGINDPKLGVIGVGIVHTTGTVGAEVVGTLVVGERVVGLCVTGADVVGDGVGAVDGDVVGDVVG